MNREDLFGKAFSAYDSAHGHSNGIQAAVDLVIDEVVNSVTRDATARVAEENYVAGYEAGQEEAGLSTDQEIRARAVGAVSPALTRAGMGYGDVLKAADEVAQYIKNGWVGAGHQPMCTEIHTPGETPCKR